MRVAGFQPASTKMRFEIAVRLLLEPSNRLLQIDLSRVILFLRVFPSSKDRRSDPLLSLEFWLLNDQESVDLGF
jgi:hypothetical protein